MQSIQRKTSKQTFLVKHLRFACKTECLTGWARHKTMLAKPKMSPKALAPNSDYQAMFCDVAKPTIFYLFARTEYCIPLI